MAQLFVSKFTGNVFEPDEQNPGRYNRIGHLEPGTGRFLPVKRPESYFLGTHFENVEGAFYPAIRTEEGDIVPASSAPQNLT